MFRRVAILVVLVACHAGAGPIVAYSPGEKVRLGGEVSGGLGPARGSFGFTASPTAGNGLIYVTLDPGVGLPLNHPVTEPGDAERYGVAAIGGTLGVAAGREASGGRLVVGGWTSGAYVHDCHSGSEFALVLSLAIGIRWLGGVKEVYAAPKVATMMGCPRLGSGQ